ncbi:MAG: hypothetical protein U9N43_08820 [Euryarchaeota archaeon]|nr:hypothetical protein [Euryarchaeota archaeon]
MKCLNDHGCDPEKCAPEQIRECRGNAETHTRTANGIVNDQSR